MFKDHGKPFNFHTNEWMIARMGRTIKSSSVKWEPSTVPKEVKSKSYDITIPAGHANGFKATVVHETTDGLII